MGKKKNIGMIAAVGGLLSALTAGIHFAYRYVFYFNDNRTEEEVRSALKGEQYEQANQRVSELMSEMDRKKYETVFITSHDGKKLIGRYYHAADGAPLEIQFHGYKSSYIRDFCGGFQIAQKIGMNTLVVDQRAHGGSEGKCLTFGILERFDCLRWAEYAAERFGKDTPIILAGLSMGAATVLMASDLDLPETVAGIIADCPYSSPKEIICEVGRKMKLPVPLFYPFIKAGARMFGHFGLEDSSAVKAVENARVPILLIHGEDDRFVPCEMSRDIYEAATGPITLETFPGAAHGLSFTADSERYERVVRAFIEEVISERATDQQE